MRDTASKTFHIRRDEAGQTLSALLRRWLPGKSWSEIGRLVRSRFVTVNGNLCTDAGRRLKAEEVVKVLVQPAAAPPSENDVVIRHLDQHLVVVEKPSGMTSNRHVEERGWPARRKQIQPTLDELLPRVIAAREKRRSKGGRGVPPPVRPVHRLDRETSGLMVFARTIAAERHLGQQFRRHTTERRYLAIVQGDVKAQTISSQLVRDRGDGRRGSTKQPDVGKQATTHVRPIERLDGYTLIECRLETGRTHQIRIHLAELGHPVCGEKVYHQPLGGKPRKDASGAPRIALHAAELGLVHPISGEQLHWKMELPADLQQLLDRLRGSD
jgi:23S rRNA pseudouridine1911/1915/1917 synthase